MATGNRRIDPVFVVGMNGSGTTMLLDSLGHHPELYAIPRETRLIPFFYANRNRYGDLNNDTNFRRLWQDIGRIPAMVQINDMKEVPLPDDWRVYERSLAAVVNGVFSDFALREGKSRWCEKTPQHVQHIAALFEMFPHATFIHMIRDGRDCARSFNRRWRRTPELTIFRWKKVVREGRRQGSTLGPDRYLEIRYEDITLDPETWLRKACTLLQVDFDPSILHSSQPYLKAAHSAGKTAAGGTIVPNSGKWRQYFSQGKLKRLERIAGSTLNTFGYATAMPDSDKDPGRLQLRMWSAKDSSQQYFREIGWKLTGKINRPWRVVLSRPLVSMRQRNVNKY